MNKFTKLRQLVRLTVTWQDSYLHSGTHWATRCQRKKTLIPLLSQVSAYIISRCTAEVNLDSIDEIMCSHDTAYNNHSNLLTTCIKVAYKKLQMAYIISSKRSRGIKRWTPTQRILLSMRNLLLPLLATTTTHTVLQGHREFPFRKWTNFPFLVKNSRKFPLPTRLSYHAFLWNSVVIPVAHVEAYWEGPTAQCSLYDYLPWLLSRRAAAQCIGAVHLFVCLFVCRLAPKCKKRNFLKN